MTRPTISAVVFTRNSAGPLLRRVLDGIRWADDIVVVDMESTDGTVDICATYTDRVFTHNEDENINANFNFGYVQAAGDYVLHVSHDYVISEALRDEMLGALAAPDRADIYRIGTLTYFFGRPVHLSVWEQQKLPLLFRKGTVVYPTARLEALPELRSAHVRTLANYVHHYTAETISELVRKYNRYSDIDVRNNPEVFPLITNPVRLAASGIGVGLYNYLFRGGYRYGMQGLIVSALLGVYYFLQRAKRWERAWKESGRQAWHQDLQP